MTGTRKAGKPPAALLASLAVHLCLFVVLFFLQGPRLPEVSDRRVVVEFAAAPRPLPEADRTGAARPRELPRIAPEALGESLQLEGPRSLSLPAGSVAPAAPPAAAAGARRETPVPQRARIPETAGAVTLPSAQEVLSLQTPGAETADPAGPGEWPEPLPTAGGERGILPAPALEWKGRARTLLASGSLAFPEILLREGRDVDVQAVFSVAPDGQVVRVEIVRSSGYAAVDREVEKALRGYLFDRAPDGGEDTGRVQFSFRLEREH